MQTGELNKGRSIAIDALRAIVMVLMIFVNDLGSLKNIPKGLEHVKADVDGMGLADVVFPAFLFIVGMAVPYAIQSRQKKSDTTATIFKHIVQRSLVLLVMGFMFVNSETYVNSGAVISKDVWVLLLVISFFLIWLDYPDPHLPKVKILKAIGVVMLIVLACIYHADTGTGILALRPQWWGILGKIGWAYFTVSSIYLFSGQKLWVQIAALVFFMLFCSASHLGWLEPVECIKDYFWVAGSGSVSALSMAGIILTMWYRKYGIAGNTLWLLALGFAVALIAFGFVTRPLWGISKIQATPSWVAICAGITVWAFMLISYLTDVKNRTAWYNFIKPAGVFTLTCYMLPYIHYSLVKITDISFLPLFLRTGGVGLIKSLIYALLIVFITGLLAKKHIRLKL
ncbi:DUF5009 domain-containing protein [Mucilaginibacter sp. JRF]|uniref:DUF5009 domain-containing protein n=1 Tax=Mucilaginibacter sp. JRF TaxID=2780088 RepID=UPI001881B1DB|nr:DUF5009 domain-containing protein [Mucilaginibacter sp. JRF]MBE9585912.1 DUF5009 domain-containing protein [Mucilaginibacter sp. JRF]